MSTSRPIQDPEVVRIRERARQERATLRARKQATAELVQTRAQTRSVERAQSVDRPKPLILSSSIAEHRREVAAQQKVSTQRANSGAVQSGSVRRVITAPASAVASTKPAQSFGSTLMVVIFTIFFLIIAYNLITNPGPAGSWLAGLSNALHLASSTTPLFQSTASATTPSTSSTDTSTGTTSAPPTPGASTASASTSSTSSTQTATV